MRKIQRGPRGAALIMTLFTLVTLTILLVGYLSSMMTEKKAASSYEGTQRAKLLSQSALAHAIDLLRTNIPEPARLAEGPSTAPAENWVTNPGRLTVIREGNQITTIPLHTGEVMELPPAGQPRNLESVDLNQALPGQRTPAIVSALDGGKAPEMRVKWQNILLDPASDASEENPLIGRYGFWIDDESSKINFNTAVGKPAPGADTRYDQEYKAGFLTPIFQRGGRFTTQNSAGVRRYALGKPQSVNLDVLFDQPSQLDHDKLLSHVFRHGFARYPEAIMNFVNLPSPKAWYDQNRFNLTFYSRSPEFNAFGRSRLFTTYIPLSLEGGPYIQHPFIYDPDSTNGTIVPKATEGSLLDRTLKSGMLKPTQVLHLNSLLGFFGAPDNTVTDGDYEAGDRNMVNRNQIEFILQVLGRKWPGYEKTFIQKYGYLESWQIALNILMHARLASTQLGSNIDTFSDSWSYRTTSVNYFPHSSELNSHSPERFYWRVRDPETGKVELMLPDNMGPYISEVRLHTQLVPNPSNAAQRHLEYWFEYEYYMPNHGPVVDVQYFPVRMDYLEVEVEGQGLKHRQQFGASDINDKRADKQWQNANMDRLATYTNKRVVLRPENVTWTGAGQPGTALPVVKSRVYTVGLATGNDANATGGKRDLVTGKDWDQTPFNWNPYPIPTASNEIEVSIRLRPGMGILSAAGRPKQMIPLGETREDTLQAKFKFNVNGVQNAQVISWQIEDPRLSHHLDRWVKSEVGTSETTGTLGKRNENEPKEDSPQKSKLRFLQRTVNDNALIAGYPYQRADEFNTAGRMASPGYWSLLSTGMQANIPWKTLDFTSHDPNNDPPDWLLLDIFGATYPMAHDQWRLDSTLPDSMSTASYLGSTSGQVNLNSRIYPRTPHFNPPDRTLPHQAVFQHLKSPSEVQAFVKAIQEYQSDARVFQYVGELSKVPGYSNPNDSPWEKETYLRNMAGVLTTKSNTFGVWGVAQAVKKLTRNKDYGTYEAGDQILGEKRFYALVERYLWTGIDGVPGNAHVNAQGLWDRLAKQKKQIAVKAGESFSFVDRLYQLPGSPPQVETSSERLDLDHDGAYPEFDGPEPVGLDVYSASALGKVLYRKTSLEEAYNPPQPVIKYRVVYFKYLDQ